MKIGFCFVLISYFSSNVYAITLKEQNEQMFKEMSDAGAATPAQIEKMRTIFDRSGYIGQGNPKITHHPVTSEACRVMLAEKKINYANDEFKKICGAPFMAPLFNPDKETMADAKTCIDQFEFPDLPCVYPVVWTRASEAAEICEAQGKRLCDAHEWEGGCAGALLPPDYEFDAVKNLAGDQAVRTMRQLHNAKAAREKNWAYGPALRKGVCGTSGTKDAECNGGDWLKCGSNTFPAGQFPDCKSRLGVYDQHGNAAEHMNLPVAPDQMASDPSQKLGHTEMKGSWFVFDKFYAHDDYCRWRAPYWHGTKVRDPKSHHNYHLSFRCCKSL